MIKLFLYKTMLFQITYVNNTSNKTINSVKLINDQFGDQFNILNKPHMNKTWVETSTLSLFHVHQLHIVLKYLRHQKYFSRYFYYIYRQPILTHLGPAIRLPRNYFTLPCYMYFHLHVCCIQQTNKETGQKMLHIWHC